MIRFKSNTSKIFPYCLSDMRDSFRSRVNKDTLVLDNYLVAVMSKEVGQPFSEVFLTSSRCLLRFFEI